MQIRLYLSFSHAADCWNNSTSRYRNVMKGGPNDPNAAFQGQGTHTLPHQHHYQKQHQQQHATLPRASVIQDINTQTQVSNSQFTIFLLRYINKHDNRNWLLPCNDYFILFLFLYYIFIHYFNIYILFENACQNANVNIYICVFSSCINLHPKKYFHCRYICIKIAVDNETTNGYLGLIVFIRRACNIPPNRVNCSIVFRTLPA